MITTVAAAAGPRQSRTAYRHSAKRPAEPVGSAPLADVPCLPELPRLIRLKYLTEVNRWTTLRGAPVALLQAATGGQPSRSLLWRDLLDSYGIGDVASLVFRDRFGCWGFLDLTVQDHLKSIFAKTSARNRRILLSRALGT